MGAGRTMVAIFVGCSAFALEGCLASHAAGSVVAQGTPIGSFQAPVAVCGSGAKQFFLGVDLLSSDGKLQMRIIQNADPSVGPSILVIPTWAQIEGKTAAFKLTRDNCSDLAIDVHPTGIAIDDVDVLAGTARFQCTLKSGGTVAGNLTFSGCS